MNLPVKPEEPSKVLEVIKNPMIFNAFAVLALLGLGFCHLERAEWWALFTAILAITAWLNIFAALNPRFLAYGPREYLRESELEHERRMAGKSIVPF